MPIKPENRALYPADWLAIRERILERDGHRCKRCRAPNYARVLRFLDGTAYMLADGSGAAFSATNGRPLGVLSGCAEERLRDGREGVRIVLTIAHLHDPDPANCADDNLAALCQRCHNLHDAPMRAAHARATRHARRAEGDLFADT